MKICLVCPWYPPHHGGTEKYVHNLAKEYCIANDVTVITSKEGKGKKISEKENLKVLKFPYIAKPLNNPVSPDKIRHILKTQKDYDVMHFNDIYAVNTLTSFFIKKTPKVLTLHSWRIRYKNPVKNTIIKSFERLMFGRIINNMDAVIALVDSQKEYLVNKAGVDPDKIHVIPNGIPFNHDDIFDYLKDKKAAKKHFRIKSNFAVGFFGRLFERKGIHLLLEAFSSFDEDLYIFGYGPLEDTVAQYAKKHKNIHFIKGPFKEKELALIHNAIDLHVLPSLSGEGCPTVLLESLSYGTLCLASDLDENMHTLKDKGLYFKKGNIKDLRKKIKTAKEMEHKPEMLREFAKRHHWKNIAEEIRNVYDKVVL